MARAAAKSAPSRPRKTAPANRGYGEKGVAKYDPSKHPRGPDGRFLSKGGAAKTTKAPRTKAPKATAKPPAKPKPPKKVGTPKQRKALADQVRKARAAAKTPEAKKALLTQVRGLRQKRSEWKRGQGKTQVEKLPKAPKQPKEKKPKEPKPKAAKAPKPTKKPTAPAKPASQPDLRTHYESLKALPDAQKHQAILDYLEKHQAPARSVKVHGMTHAEDMHSIPLDGYNLHYPKGDTDLVIRTTRGFDLSGPLPKELSRHTTDVYMTRQANRDDPHWAKVHGRPGLVSEATGGGGSVVFYRGTGAPSVLSHEMGHNLAQAKYGSTRPSELSKFTAATRGEKPPTDYAATSPQEDFAESVMMYTHGQSTFKQKNPKRYRVIDRLLRDPNYAG